MRVTSSTASTVIRSLQKHTDTECVPEYTSMVRFDYNAMNNQDDCWTFRGLQLLLLLFFDCWYILPMVTHISRMI